MPGVREPGHVDADLGDDRFGGPLRHPRDGVEVVTGLFERDAGLVGVGREQGVDLVVESGHGRFEVIDVVEAHPDQQGVMVTETSLQGPAQLGDLVAELALGQVCECLGIALTGDERAQHGPARHAHDVRRDRVQLDARVLESLLDALALLGVGLHEALAVAGQIPQLADHPGRHEAPSQQAVLEQLRDPLGVEDIALATREDLEMMRVDEFLLERPFLEHVPDRLPVRPGCLHRHLGDARGGEPVRHHLQVPDKGPEATCVLMAPTPAGHRSPHARHDLVFADVDPSATFQHHVHGHPLRCVLLDGVGGANRSTTL